MALDGIAFTTIWTGTTSTDANTAGNWGGGTVTGIPVDGSVIGVLGSAAALGKNITLSATLKTIQATLLYIDPTFPYQIGTSANRCDIDGVTVIHRGSGKLWFKTGDVGTTTLIVDCPGNNDAFDIDISGTGVCTNVIVLRGKGTIGGAAGASLITGGLYIGSKGNVASDVQLTSTMPATSTIAKIQQYGGEVVAMPNIVTAWNLNAGRATKTSTGALTTLEQSAGYMSYEGTGAITTGRIFGGQFDATRNRSATVVFTDMWLFGSRRSTIYNVDNRLVVHTNGPHDERSDDNG